MNDENKIQTVNGLLKKLEEITKQPHTYVYRGLASKDWEMEPSLSRRIGKNVDMYKFQSRLKELIDRAKLKGFNQENNRTLSDLELSGQATTSWISHMFY